MNNIISIIVPIYKVEKYLKRCIESLIHQDYQDIEIILVDDGSPDNCGIICDEYANKDTRIKVIHQKNGGLSAARNSGIDIAHGDYLMFVDSDDWVETNFCSFALKKCIETRSDIVVFGYNDVFNDRIVKRSIAPKNEKKYTTEEALKELHGGKILSFAWNKIYKADLFKTSIRYPKGRLFEDIGTTYLLFHQANAVYLASGATYNYQKREDSILGKKMKAKDAIDWFDLEMERLLFMKQNYPDVATSLWGYYGKRTLFLCKVLSNYPNQKEKLQEMENFLVKNKQQIKEAGVKDIELTLLWCSPSLFNGFRKLKSLIKRFK